MKYLGNITELNQLKFRDVAGNVFTMIIEAQNADRQAGIPQLTNDDVFVFEDEQQTLRNKSFFGNLFGLPTNRLSTITESVPDFMRDWRAFWAPSAKTAAWTALTAPTLGYAAGTTANIQQQFEDNNEDHDEFRNRLIALELGVDIPEESELNLLSMDTQKITASTSLVSDANLLFAYSTAGSDTTVLLQQTPDVGTVVQTSHNGSAGTFILEAEAGTTLMDIPVDYYAWHIYSTLGWIEIENKDAKDYNAYNVTFPTPAGSIIEAGTVVGWQSPTDLRTLMRSDSTSVAGYTTSLSNTRNYPAMHIVLRDNVLIFAIWEISSTIGDEVSSPNIPLTLNLYAYKQSGYVFHRIAEVAIRNEVYFGSCNIDLKRIDDDTFAILHQWGDTNIGDGSRTTHVSKYSFTSDTFTLLNTGIITKPFEGEGASLYVITPNVFAMVDVFITQVLNVPTVNGQAITFGASLTHNNPAIAGHHRLISAQISANNILIPRGSDDEATTTYIAVVNIDPDTLAISTSPYTVAAELTGDDPNSVWGNQRVTVVNVSPTESYLVKADTGGVRYTKITHNSTEVTQVLPLTDTAIPGDYTGGVDFNNMVDSLTWLQEGKIVVAYAQNFLTTPVYVEELVYNITGNTLTYSHFRRRYYAPAPTNQGLSVPLYGQYGAARLDQLQKPTSLFGPYYLIAAPIDVTYYDTNQNNLRKTRHQFFMEHYDPTVTASAQGVLPFTKGRSELLLGLTTQRAVNGEATVVSTEGTISFQGGTALSPLYTDAAGWLTTDGILEVGTILDGSTAALLPALTSLEPVS